MAPTLLPLATLLLAFSASFLQIGEAETDQLTALKLNSHILQESIAKEVNENPGAGWKAAINPRFSNSTMYEVIPIKECDLVLHLLEFFIEVAQFKRLLGVKQTPRNVLNSIPVVTHPKSSNLPKEFDARTAWSQCSTIGRVLDQGHCGSCWAFGAVESLSDRFCIHFGVDVPLSVNDLLACCGFLCGSGCDGGYPISAWRYLAHHGVVTEECDPYFDQIGCSHPGCEPAYQTPKCVRKCVKGNQLWKKSKRYSVKAYRVNSDPQNIMEEVYKNGPVEVAFSVYEDFAHYKSGVYKHITGSALGGHAVKLIGWGTSDEGEDYWLLANQWNTNWGDDGYFKIRRGTNECGIEEDVTAGLPSPKNVIREVADTDVDADVSF